MLHSALLYNNVKRHGEELGLTNSRCMGYNLSGIQKYKDSVIRRLASGIELLFKNNGIALYRGTGTVLKENFVSVEDENGEVL